MPDNDNNNIEIEILPPEPGHNRSDSTREADEAYFQDTQAAFAPRPWQIILFRVIRTLIILACLVAAFFLGTVVLGIVAVLIVAGALWMLWLRATGRSPGIHFRRF